MPKGVYIRTEKHKQALKVPHSGSGIYVRTKAPWNKGKKMNNETKRKISIALKGRIPLYLVGKKLSPEHKLKLSIAKKGKKLSEATKEKMRGRKPWNWIEDRTKLAKLSNGNEYRNSPVYKEWRLNVYKRDNYKCRIDNCECSGRIIAHHILSWSKFPELRYEVNNGITLCQFHHPLKRNDEKKLIPTLQELVIANSICQQ